METLSNCVVVATDAANLVAKLSEKFETVKIKRSDFDEAERKLRGELIEKWDEKCTVKMTGRIPIDKLDEFMQMLKRTHELDDKLIEELLSIKYSKTKDRVVCEFKAKKEFESKYGFIALVRDQQDNTVSCAYAIHQLTFKMAPRRIKVEKTQWLFGFIPIGTDVSYETEKVKFGTNDIERFKNTYMRYKALEALKNEGVIEAINFE